jgi:hypothetical protein
MIFGNDTAVAVRLGAAGADFAMIPQPLTIMNDDERPDRMSRPKDWRRVLSWAVKSQSMLGDRSYLAYRGWHVARIAAENGRYATALKFYAAALLRGAFPPRLAIKALIQILVRRSLYSKFRTTRALRRIG